MLLSGLEGPGKGIGGCVGDAGYMSGIIWAHAGLSDVECELSTDDAHTVRVRLHLAYHSQRSYVIGPHGQRDSLIPPEWGPLAKRY